MLMAIFVVLSNAFGNLFLTFGMREVDEVTLSVVSLIAPIFDPWVMGGIILLVSWMLARMTFLSWADLTYVLPVTAFGYVISAMLGMLFLAEQITPERWAGIGLIVTGTVLVGLGNPHLETARQREEADSARTAEGTKQEVSQ